MPNHAYLVHGWGGNPRSGFFPWLKSQLEALPPPQNYAVTSLLMPDSSAPRIEAWVPHLVSHIKNPDHNTLLVGHSMGANAILRYLEQLPEGVTVGKVILVAPIITSVTNFSAEEWKMIGQPWCETPIDFEKVKRSARQITAFFSDNDKYIPPANHKAARDLLGTKIIIEPNMGHYSGNDGITEVPRVMREIVEI